MNCDHLVPLIPGYIQAELTELREIVGELAESRPIWDVLFPANGPWYCRYCGAKIVNPTWPNKDHASDCLWLRSQRWKP